MYDLLKCSNMHTIGDPKRKDGEYGTEAIFKEIMGKNIFSNEVKWINSQIKKAQEGYRQNLTYTQQTKIILLLKYQRQKKIKTLSQIKMKSSMESK